jgi:hypothetical protein
LKQKAHHSTFEPCPHTLHEGQPLQRNLLIKKIPEKEELAASSMQKKSIQKFKRNKTVGRTRKMGRKVCFSSLHEMSVVGANRRNSQCFSMNFKAQCH